MWLINTTSLKLEHFVDPEERGGQYAILSHTWEHEEVSFQQIQNLSHARTMAGFSKIKKTCELARSCGLKYAWVDTCCIDKSSSAELSEAINSMFNYYRLASVCYVYLSDLPDVPSMDLPNFQRTLDLDSKLFSAAEIAKLVETEQHAETFGGCRWFTRGWTLQELIAPSDVVFHNSSWRILGTKKTLPSLLGAITGIDPGILKGSSELASIPACVRMSWAAARDTTRVEDIAYCLLGIFDVSLPLIYGEGCKAFQRLQEEILRTSGDLSLLSWSPSGLVDSKYLPTSYRNATAMPRFRGPFAWCPSEFSQISAKPTDDWLQPRPVKLDLVNGAIEVSTDTTVQLNESLDDTPNALWLDTPGSANPNGHRMVRTPLGYAFTCKNERAMAIDKHWREIGDIQKIRIISQLDALSISRNTSHLAHFILNISETTGFRRNIKDRNIYAWPAHCFEKTRWSFAFVLPGTYPEKSAYLLGAVSYQISIPSQPQCDGDGYELNFLFCCGVIIKDKSRVSFRPWGLTFCEQATDENSRAIYDAFRGMETDERRRSIKNITGHVPGGQAYGFDFVVNCFKDRLENIRVPGHTHQGPCLRYNTRLVKHQTRTETETFHQFDLRLERRKEGGSEMLHIMR